MKKIIFQLKEQLEEGILISRENRFTLNISFRNKVEKAYLPNPGRLSTVLEQGRQIFCVRKNFQKRKTLLNAFAVKLNGIYATIDSHLANSIFEQAVIKNLLPFYKNFSIECKEKIIPEYGKIDFILKNQRGTRIFVEVKSCTHVEKGIAKFPDSPTLRGRKHLKNLIEMRKKGLNTSIVFVVQRPDAISFTPFKEIDAEFHMLLKRANINGVIIKVFSTEFTPEGQIYLKRTEIPIRY